MISRRNIRIKLMQLLYQSSFKEEVNHSVLRNQYKTVVDDAYNLYVFILFIIDKVSHCDKIDFDKRKTKLRPTAEDALFKVKMDDNIIISSIRDNEDYGRKVNSLDLNSKIDISVVYNIYNELLKEEFYKAEAEVSSTIDSDRAFMLKLLKFLAKNEIFNDIIEDYYPCWDDEKEIAIGSIKKTIKCVPVCFDFMNDYKPNNETVVEYGEAFLDFLIKESGDIEKIIIAYFDNWDPTRVAKIDMIFLKMAYVEFVHFETIPIKVTINEYIELSKKYSTDKSKEFVNGILNKLSKDLIEKEVINKEGRGLNEV